MNKQFTYLTIAMAIIAINKTIASEKNYQETIANITQSTCNQQSELENQHKEELQNLLAEYQQNISAANDLKTKIILTDKYMRESTAITKLYTADICQTTHNTMINIQTAYKKEEKKTWDELSKK